LKALRMSCVARAAPSRPCKLTSRPLSREELKDTGVTVTCLMPGATETKFFRRADMLDTKVGTAEKDDPADVAKNGFKAMMSGEGGVVSGWQNKLQAAAAHVIPAERLAKKHSETAAPGTAEK
jgi:uncharacterized protein